MCLGEHDGTGGEQELPQALTVGSMHVHSLTQGLRRLLGKRLNLHHRPPPRLWPKPEWKSMGPQQVKAIPGEWLGFVQFYWAKRRKKEGPGLGHSEDVRGIARRLCLFLVP